MEKNLIFILLFLISILYSCSEDFGKLQQNKSGKSNNSSKPMQITFAGVGDHGIFDPSLAKYPSSDRIWMSYSEVDDYPYNNLNFAINTRLAYSDNFGASWQDIGIINESAPLGPAPQNLANWEHEVSSICYDPGAPVNERWKLVWHRYLCLNNIRLFEHSWIGMKTAPSPDGPWSSERKLFVGSLYDHIDDDPIIGPPEIELNKLHTDLNECLVFSEPALIATDNAFYCCMLGAEGSSTNGRIILLKYNHLTNTWEYMGTFIHNNIDGPSLGYDGFSAPSIYKKNNKYYLIVTPQKADKYLGTFIFEILDLDSATLNRENGILVVVKSIYGRDGSHNGAAGYIPESYASGILYSDVMLVTPLDFRIYASLINPW